MTNFFLISRIQLFYIYPPCVHTFQWTLSEFFFDFRIFSRKSRSQQKQAKRITHFAMQFRTKNLTYFKKLNSLDIEYAPPTQLKTSVKFSSKHVFVWCQKRTFELHHFLTPKAAYFKRFESKCPYISVYLRKKMFVPKT